MLPDPANSTGTPLLERGVYTLANDAVIEWFQAFIRSLRQTDPDIPLTVIPYDESTSQLQGLAKEYRFTIMKELECRHFDSLEEVVMGQGNHAAMFRKWACFFGAYKNFIFLDSDIVILSSLDEILNAFSISSYDLIYFDVNITMVYTPAATPEMTVKYGSRGFNAGAFVSRKGIISDEELTGIAQKAASDRHKLKITQVDQPFLNYVFDTTQRRTACIDSILPKLAAFAWARQPFTYDWKTNVARNGEGKIIPFIHWAGCAYPTMVRLEVFLHYRSIGLSFAARMKYKGIFYLRRCRANLFKARSHVKKAGVCLCKLIGIKTNAPI